MKYYSINEVADMFDVPISSVNRWLERRELSFELVDDDMKFSEVDIQIFRAKGKRLGLQIIK